MDIVWICIIGAWFYAFFKGIDWAVFVAGPCLLGLFLIVTYKKEVENVNEIYTKRTKQMPALFPPSFVNKTSLKFQRFFTIMIGAAFVLLGIVNLIEMLNW